MNGDGWWPRAGREEAGWKICLGPVRMGHDPSGKQTQKRGFWMQGGGEAFSKLPEMNAPFVVFADPYCPRLAHDDGASMQIPCALHGSLLDVNGNALPQAALGRIQFGSHHPETGNVHNRCSHPRVHLSGPFMFCFFWRLLRQSVKSGESDPAKSPPHQFRAAGAAPAGSASKRW